MTSIRLVPKHSKRARSHNDLVEAMFFTFLVGTAGSGKSLLTSSLEKFLVEAETSVTVVNLDPGVDDPPYTSDVDIREYVNYGEVMQQFGLGPNGALVASLDMAIGNVGDLHDEILELDRDYVLVDCPGQMELFAYRNSGPLMVSSLMGQDPAVSLYLLDANIARTPVGYLSSMLLGISISIRFGLPQIGVLSKPDILMEEQIDEVLSWSSETYTLEEALNDSSSGLVREYSSAILRMLNDIGGGTTVVPVSAKLMTGVELLYAELQRAFLGGDNLIV
ncbi:MAG: ATP/GTP-binding protein [Candidatus Thorarchaeota archaeon]